MNFCKSIIAEKNEIPPTIVQLVSVQKPPQRVLSEDELFLRAGGVPERGD